MYICCLTSTDIIWYIWCSVLDHFYQLSAATKFNALAGDRVCEHDTVSGCFCLTIHGGWEVIANLISGFTPLTCSLEISGIGAHSIRQYGHPFFGGENWVIFVKIVKITGKVRKDSTACKELASEIFPWTTMRSYTYTWSLSSRQTLYKLLWLGISSNLVDAELFVRAPTWNLTGNWSKSPGQFIKKFQTPTQWYICLSQTLSRVHSRSTVHISSY